MKTTSIEHTYTKSELIAMEDLKKRINNIISSSKKEDNEYKTALLLKTHSDLGLLALIDIFVDILNQSGEELALDIIADDKNSLKYKKVNFDHVNYFIKLFYMHNPYTIFLLLEMDTNLDIDTKEYFYHVVETANPTMKSLHDLWYDGNKLK